MNSPIPFIANADDTSSAAWVNALQQAMPDERVVAFSSLDPAAKTQCTVAIVANPEPSALRQLSNLRWVHSVWAGVERLVADLEACQSDRPPGHSELKIVRLIDPQLAATMAEAVLAWTLYLHRDMPAYAEQQAQARWQPRPYIRPQNRSVSLLGLGALGLAAARQLTATGFKVRGWSQTRKSLPEVECFAGNSELDAMLAQTDILISLLPLTEQTTGILNARTLARLPADAELINFSRGAIIDDQALCAALDSGHLKHAVLDVFALEPLAEDQWQWRHPRVTVLPHCSAPTDQASAVEIVARHIAAYRASGEIPPSVDLVRGY